LYSELSHTSDVKERIPGIQSKIEPETNPRDDAEVVARVNQPPQFNSRFEQRVERKKLDALKGKDEIIVAQLDAISKANTSIALPRRKVGSQIRLLNEVSSIKSKTFALADSLVSSTVPANLHLED
jgi:hypothetical protein